jgi:hypothetical protein
MKFGRNQIIAIGAMAAPFAAATVAMFMKTATFVEWAAYMQIHIPLTVGIALGGSAVTKVAGSMKAAGE